MSAPSAYGHFGRQPDNDGGFSWERLDLVEPIRGELELGLRALKVRHGPARPGHPRSMQKIVDARHKAGHDGAMANRRLLATNDRYQTAQVLWQAESQAVERAEGAADRRAVAASAPRPRRVRRLHALTELFQVPVNEVWLEIGFGSGEHLLWQAETHEDVGFIGCEPFINGVGSLLGAIEDRGIETIRVHDGDAREVLAWLPNRSIGRVFLLFPDPWPKKRQLKRRLLCEDTLAEIARVLRPGGEFDLPPTTATMPRKRCASRSEAIFSPGPPSARPIGGSGQPTGQKRAMNARRAARDESRLISVSAGVDLGERNGPSRVFRRFAVAPRLGGRPRRNRYRRRLLCGLRGRDAFQPRIQSLPRPRGRQGRRRAEPSL